MKLRSIRATTEGTIKTADLFSEYQLEPYFDADSPLILASTAIIPYGKLALGVSNAVRGERFR